MYYYNTSPAFAEEPIPGTVPEPPHFSDSDLKTVDAVIEQKRQKTALKAKESAPVPEPTAPAAASAAAEATLSPDAPAQPEASAHAPGSPEALEEEAGQQGAFNPETGEINWDCPCLGGMADGPCGEQFKAAFSCFVYSTEEPKGIDCIEKFQGMQECFREYPEIYSAEIADDEEADAAAANAEGAAPAAAEKAATPASEETKPAEPKAEPKEQKKPETKAAEQTPAAADALSLKSATESAPAESPKKFSDATDANADVKSDDK